ncbi:hypothetical protein Tco_0034019 [Tanacetum coccineum]
MEKEVTKEPVIRSCFASRIRNIDGKILGKDGKPMLHVRNVQYEAKNLVSNATLNVEDPKDQQKTQLENSTIEENRVQISFADVGSDFVLPMDSITAAKNRVNLPVYDWIFDL